MRHFRLNTAALLACIMVTLTCTAYAQDTSLQSLLTGSETTPLSLTLKDLNGSWRRVTTSGQESPANLTQLYISLYARRGQASEYYTQGRTVSANGEIYLVAYRVQLNIPDLSTLMREGAQGLPNSPPLTSDTRLVLCLLDLHTLGSLTDIQPFDQMQTVPEMDDETSVSNLKRISLGLIQYVQDYDEKLPPLESPIALKKAIYPYVKSDDLFLQPGNHVPYGVNMSLSHRTLASFSDPATMVLLYEAIPMPDGTRAVAFLDGHVKRFPESSWPALKRASHVPGPIESAPGALDSVKSP